MYKNLKRYHKAMENLNKALEIRKKSIGKNSLPVA